MTTLSYGVTTTGGTTTTVNANNAVLSSTDTQTTSTTYNLNTSALTTVPADPNALIPGVMRYDVAGALDSQLLYTIDVPAGSSLLHVQTDGGTGDADLYLRFGAPPTLDTFDYRSWDSSAANEVIAVTNPATGRWYVMVHAFTEISNVRLIAHLDTSPSDVLVQPGTPVNDLHAGAGTDLLYRFDLPAGVTDLRIELTGGDGDADLYLKQGQPPVFDPFDIDWWSENANNEELIDIDTPVSAGTWYLLVRAYTSFTGARLSVNYNLDINLPPTVNAGADQTVAVGANVTLSGSAADADGIASVSWRQLDGPAVSLNGANTLIPSFTAQSASGPTRLRFELTATDAQGVISTDTVSVAVRGASIVYVVQSGDTWASIATALYGNSGVADELQAAMGNQPLAAGEQLSNLPASLTDTVTTTTTVPPYYTVQASDTWASITQTVYGTSDANAVSTLQSSLGNPTLTTGLRLTVP
ncbi:MAG TPA: pre-peptidase C-terminal domain-containing protein, partial [bacterium]|nr:pre-peptidase C-terminal domain-containing protein [bacterium]